MSFMNNLQNVLGEELNESVTENGAIGYATSGKELLDINFKITSFRNAKEDEIVKAFWKAYYENQILACKWLFYASDVRGGVGERRLFRICFKELCEKKPTVAKVLLNLIPEYSRWDNMFIALGTSLEDQVIEIVKNQLNQDMVNMKEQKPISLLAKWMPSANASSADTKAMAKIFITKIGLTPRQYRKMLSALRRYLDVVERKMSSKEWEAIDYNKVPSRANLMYNSAFLRNDEDRRRQYLDSLSKGETKINAGTLFPHDIAFKYRVKIEWDRIIYKNNVDVALEEMWKALPDFIKGDDSTICVSDGSGSMIKAIMKAMGKDSVTKIEVAQALSIYFAERCKGEFKNKFITFSESPRLIDLSNGRTLLDKLRIINNFTEVANTNIEAVFDLILLTALKHKMKPEDLPKNILILSDMEFDSCACCSTNFGGRRFGYGNSNTFGLAPKLFNIIKERFEAAGYQLPRLVFWNIGSTSGTIPIKTNDLGVALVSGFSPAVMKMVLSNKTDPFDCLLEQLNDVRYQPVEDALKDVVM